MGRTKNQTKMVCDRCGKTDYFDETTDPRKNSWYDIKRYTAGGGEPVSYLLCDECNKLYKQLVNTQDGEFNTFMANKEA